MPRTLLLALSLASVLAPLPAAAQSPDADHRFVITPDGQSTQGSRIVYTRRK